MKTTKHRELSALPQFSTTDLNELRQQLDGWRRSNAPRSRIPDQVWKSAATLTRHGVSKVAGTLRLDYYKVRQHATGSTTPPSIPGFVEIPWAGSSPSMAHTCTVELVSTRGGRMIVRWTGAQTTLVALAQAFWKGQR